LALDEADFLGVFPLAGEGRARFIGTVRAERENVHVLEWKDVSPAVLERLDVRVRRVNWFSTYHVHHRVASVFRSGRAFIAGDAAHIHSPVGGQGMNTGIGDAVNLAWKLAAVLRRSADPHLLDTYDPERMAFANRLVETTDRAFTLVTSDGLLARFVRLRIVPRLLPRLFEIGAVRRFMFRVVSQTAIEYRASALSRDCAGAIQGGDRLPWVPDADGHADNHAALATLDWQVHVYGRAAPDLERLCAERVLALHAFPWSDAARRAGLARDAAYLVRPDGYVALAQADGRAAKIGAHLD